MKTQGKQESRPYQTAAVKNIEAALASRGRVLAVGPTGCGKTVIAARVIARAKGRVLFVAHRIELIDQAWSRLASAGIEAGVIMAQDERLRGGSRTNEDAMVQVASVQTLARRGVPKGVRLIVFDEAHRVMADSYQAIAAAAPRARVLGLTATPVRQDGKPLSEFFGRMISIAKPSDLYRDRFLSRPKTYAAPAGMVAELMTRMKGVPSNQGDYQPAALGRAVDTSILVGNVVDEKIRLAPGVPCVVFACTVAHSKRMVEAFCRRGIKARHLDAKTPPEERARILDDLRTGLIEVVSNVNVLSEGWDLPALGVVCIARPTRSIACFLQMTGRVQRPHPGPTPLVLDHGDNARRLGILPDDDVDWEKWWTGGADKEVGTPVVKACPKCQRMMAGGCATCPGCGAEQLIDRGRTEKEEVEARLAELRRKFDDFKSRAETIANRKGLPSAWVSQVVRREGARLRVSAGRGGAE